MEKIIRRAKVRKPVGWDKDSLIHKAKSTHKQSKMRNSFTSSHGQAGVQPQESRAPSFMMVDGYLGRKTPSLRMSLHFLLLPQLYMLSITPHGVGYPLGQLVTGLLAVPPPNLSCSPSLHVEWVGWGTEKVLTLCPAMKKTHLYHQHSFQYNFKTEPCTSYYRKK